MATSSGTRHGCLRPLLPLPSVSVGDHSRRPRMFRTPVKAALGRLHWHTGAWRGVRWASDGKPSRGEKEDDSGDGTSRGADTEEDLDNLSSALQKAYITARWIDGLEVGADGPQPQQAESQQTNGDNNTLQNHGIEETAARTDAHNPDAYTFSSTLSSAQTRHRAIFRKNAAWIEPKSSESLETTNTAANMAGDAFPVVRKIDKAPKRQIHFLGSDPKALYFAHVLRNAYKSVELVYVRNRLQYTNITMDSPDRASRQSRPVPHAALSGRGLFFEPSRTEGPITDLIVTQNSPLTIESIRSRINNQTTICMLPDGLGLAEHVRDKILGDRLAKPSFVLGHVPRSIVFDRKTNSVRQMPRSLTDNGTYLTTLQPIDYFNTRRRSNVVDRRPRELLDNFESADYLAAETLPFDNWLRLKLPSMVFSSIADPICAVLDCRYDELMLMPRAARLVASLLSEISRIVVALPEVQNTPEIRLMFLSDAMMRYCMVQLRAKGKAVSPMALRLRMAHWTDIDYFNGYFVRRGKELGIAAPANEMMVSMVKARYAQEKRRRREILPFDAALQL